MYFTTLDVYLSAFLQFKGIAPTFELQNGKVIFRFKVTEDLYRLIDEYHSNITVPCLDYVVAIKTLRGSMLALRR